MFKRPLLLFGLLLFRSVLQASWLAPEERAETQHQVAVVGTGYVGLTLGTCLAECGHEVICIDIDAEKIARLNRGIIPIYEPGLSELVQSNAQEGRLSFTTSLEQAAGKSDIIFIAVGTPTEANGQADLSALFKVVDILKPYNDRLICIKSTVPVGTCRYIQSQLATNNSEMSSVEIVSNPEFFREGCAVKDFFEGDRIIVGCNSCQGMEVMQELYAPLINKGMSMLVTSLESSEMIKYASNAFLAAKIAYINELSQLCEKTGADVLEVAKGIGLDRRIGKDFLKPGPGYGGSCFPKDTVALLNAAKTHGVDLQIVDAAINANEQHKQKIYDKTLSKLHGSDQVVAILGLAFKANTDDIRYSPALGLISALQSKGIAVRAYDPAAADNTKAQFPDVVYCQNPYEAAEGADCLVLLTDWEEFLHLDISRLKSAMRTLTLYDTRNMLDGSAFEAEGFSYEGIGRPVHFVQTEK